MYSFRLDLTVLALIAGLTLTASSTTAQSQSDLRRENQRLLTDVSDLQRELETARQTIEQLEAEIERLREMIEQGGGSPGRTTTVPEPQPEPVTIDESVPTASPRALLRMLKTKYREELGDVPGGANPGDQERITYLRALERWVSQVNREFHVPIRWYVTLESRPRPQGRGFQVQVQAVDPKTEYRLGEQFTVFLPRTLAARLQHRDYDWEDVMVMGAVMIPQVRINLDRLEEGPFNSPPLIGTFVEFEMRAEARTLLPKEMVEEDEPDEDEADEEEDHEDGD